MKKKIRAFLQWALYGGTLESYRDTCQELSGKLHETSLQLKKVLRESTDAKMDLVKARDENGRLANKLTKEANKVITLTNALDRVVKERDAARLFNDQVTAERDRLAAQFKSEQRRCSSLMGTMRELKRKLNVVVVVMVAVLLTACATRTKVVTVQTSRTDTAYVRQLQHDSIWLHDSIYVEKGDTLRIERWHTKYVESIRRDTVYRSKTDSVPIPYPVEVIKEVEKPLSWWQKFRMTLGTIALGAVGVGIVLLIFKVKKNTLG